MPKAYHFRHADMRYYFWFCFILSTLIYFYYFDADITDDIMPKALMTYVDGITIAIIIKLRILWCCKSASRGFHGHHRRLYVFPLLAQKPQSSIVTGRKSPLDFRIYILLAAATVLMILLLHRTAGQAYMSS